MNFERKPPRDLPCQVWFNLVQRFQRRRFKCDLLSKYAIMMSFSACVTGFFMNFELLPILIDYAN
jgi:hypothetical protein